MASVRRCLLCAGPLSVTRSWREDRGSERPSCEVEEAPGFCFGCVRRGAELLRLMEEAARPSVRELYTSEDDGLRIPTAAELGACTVRHRPLKVRTFLGICAISRLEGVIRRVLP